MEVAAGLAFRFIGRVSKGEELMIAGDPLDLDKELAEIRTLSSTMTND
jgi:hypothetical protein